MSVSETPALKLQINDSDAIHRSDLTERLSACGYAVVEASDGEEGFNVLVRDQPDAVVTELCMSPVDGWDFMRRARTVRPLMPTIILTEDTSEDTLLKALRMGVCDFLRKGTAVRAIDRAVRAAVEGVPTARRFREETRDIIGTSDSIEGLRLKIDKIGTAGRATVLILGESGTGKELVAHRIHRLSQRNGAFVPVNCAMSDGGMVENSLFGHEKGAFTDAKSREKGLVEYAHGGTLFLDEVGEMPLDVQAKLLRFLETGAFRRIGGNEEIWVDTRVIAATNRDLKTMVAKGTFREDLYFRLNVLPVTVPPLRERDRDVLLLAEQFIQRASERLGQPQPQISADARRQLVQHPWPGNVRELKNLMERFVLMQEGLTLDIGDLGPTANLAPSVTFPPMDVPFADAKRQFEYEYFRTLLEKHRGNVAGVARAAGLDPSNVRRVLRRHDLQAQAFR